jgi:glycosyltransferase involved in cell wall biosynthesis
MLSVLIPTLNSERELARTLACLVTATVQGLVREVILVDGGSRDETAAIADETGANFLTVPPGRAGQLRAGVKAARSSWFLFLTPGAVLEPGWAGEATSFIEAAEMKGGRALERAAVFRFALDDAGPRARCSERLTALRGAVLGLPRAEQGLLISRRFYERVGGYPETAMADAALLRAIGGQRLAHFRTAAVVSLAPDSGLGGVMRPLCDLAKLSLYKLGLPPRFIGGAEG